MAESVFDRWLRSLEESTEDHPLVPALEVVLDLANLAFHANLRIQKKPSRRSSVAPGGKETPSPGLETIPLNFHTGLYLVADGWGSLSRRERARLIIHLRRLAYVKKASSTC